jgi:hypothetical protein
MLSLSLESLLFSSSSCYTILFIFLTRSVFNLETPPINDDTSAVENIPATAEEQEPVDQNGILLSPSLSVAATQHTNPIPIPDDAECFPPTSVPPIALKNVEATSVAGTFFPQHNVGSEDVNGIFQLLSSRNAATATTTAAELSQRITTNSLHDSVVKAYLEKAGLKPFSMRQANLNLLKRWVDESPERHPYFLPTKAQLIAICVTKFGGSLSSYQKEGKEEHIQVLAAHHFHAPAGGATPSHSAHSSSSIQHLRKDSVRTSLLKKIVEASFMPKLTAKGKEYCKSGHQLERPFGNNLLQHSKEGITRFRVLKLFCVGLVGKNGEMYAKASANFIGVAIIHGRETLFAVECKGRLTPGMHQHKHEHAELLSRGRLASATTGTSISTTVSNGDEKELYTVIEATSGEYHKYITSTHEAVQLMHTSYVFDFKYVLLLVGDSYGNIIRGGFIKYDPMIRHFVFLLLMHFFINQYHSGVWVYFEDHLLQDYGEVLSYIYKTALSWAYEPEVQFPKEGMEIALKGLKNVDSKSFASFFHLLRFVSFKLPLPIPRLERIVPLAISLWNAAKGGSDTPTKYLWFNMYDPPKQFNSDPCNCKDDHAYECDPSSS